MYQSSVSAIIPLCIASSLPYQPSFALRFSKLQLAPGWDCPVSKQTVLSKWTVRTSWRRRPRCLDIYSAVKLTSCLVMITTISLIDKC